MKASLIISAIAILPLSSFAEQSKETRSCRVIFPLAANDAPKSIYMVDGKQCREIELPRLNLSQPIPLPDGELTLSFSDKQRDPSDPTLNEAPSVVIGKQSKDVYLVVTNPAGDDGKRVLNFRIMDAGTDRLTIGQMLWLNLSEVNVSGKVGTRNVEIEPGKEVILDQPATGRSTYFVELNFTDPQTKDQRPLMESQWRHDPQCRVLALVIQDGDRKTPRILTFSDYPSNGAP